MSLDFLGADGLSGQYITLRIKSVDAPKLAQAIGSAGAAVPAALWAVDLAPGTVLKAALPFVVKKAKADYGVDLEYNVTDAPPAPGEHTSDVRGIVKGLGLAAAGWAAWHYGRPLLK